MEVLDVVGGGIMAVPEKKHNSSTVQRNRDYEKTRNLLKIVVPGEAFEPPTG